MKRMVAVCFVFVLFNILKAQNDYIPPIWFGGKIGHGVIFLKADSTFEYKYYFNNGDRERSSGSYKKDADTLLLTSNSNTGFVPITSTACYINSFDSLGIYLKINNLYNLSSVPYRSTIIPYINGRSMLMFYNSDNLVLHPILDENIKTLSFKIIVYQGHSYPKSYQTKTIFFENDSVFFPSTLKINVDINEQLADFKVFCNTKVILFKNKIGIQNTDGKIGWFKIRKKIKKEYVCGY